MRSELALAIILGAAMVGASIYLLTVNEPAYTLFVVPPPELLLEIQGVRWPEDPAGGIQIDKKYEPDNHHRATLNGTVTRGTYATEEGNKTRGYVYANFTAAANSGCSESAWYSWVWPTVELEENGAFVQKQYKGKIRAATGLDVEFDKWNKDYQKKWAEDENKKRAKAGKMPFPAVDPDGAGGLPPGQPYCPFDTPAGKGFLDSPTFSDRNSAGSAAEKIFRQISKIKSEKQSQTKPPDETHRLKITTHGHTYLYCIRPVQCLGWFEWDSVETVTISVEWVEKGMDMGIGAKTWKSGTKIVSSSSVVSMGPWQNCS